MSHLFDDGSVAPRQCSNASRAERFRLFAERIAQRRFVAEETAASMAEYALMLAVVALALVLVIGQFRGAIGNTITRTNSSLASVADGNGGGGGDDDGGRGSCGTPPCGRGPNGDGPPGQDP